MIHSGDVRQDSRGTEIVERGGSGAASRFEDDVLERCDNCERSLLAGDAEADAGLNEVHREGLQPSGEGGLQPNIVGAEDGAGGHTIGAAGGQAIQHRMRPCAGSGDEGPTLQHGFAMALLRAGKRLGEFSDIMEVGFVLRTPVRLGKQHGVVPARTEGDEIGKPFLKGIGLGQRPVIRGTFEPMAVGEAANRKGW